jgi:hypothetical protein
MTEESPATCLPQEIEDRITADASLVITHLEELPVSEALIELLFINSNIIYSMCAPSQRAGIMEIIRESCVNSFARWEEEDKVMDV